MPARSDFVRVDYDQPHFHRMRAIMEAHPEVRQLFGTDSRMAGWTVALVAAQLLLGAWAAQQSWWVMLLTAYVVGAVISHALWVVIHECAHRLVFRGALLNRLLSLLANWPHLVPGAIAFSKYHLLHHAHQGTEEYDGDLAGPAEARWVGSSTWRKMLWILFFSFVQGTLRPAQLKRVRLVDGWTLANLGTQLLLVAWYVPLAGWGAVGYLALSTLFSIGFHPLGGRWIAEHYLQDHDHQETFSYYGPANKVAFNVGYHNEHHDFMQVPWSRLPRLREIAPEYYEDLYQHQSWTRVLARFLFTDTVSLYDRIVRPSDRKLPPGRY